MTVQKLARKLLGLAASATALLAITANAADPRVEALFQQATLAYDRGDYAAAIENWQKVIDINPEHTVAHYDLCAAHNKAEDVRTAMGHCDMAIRLDPQYVDAFYLRGLILTEKLGENKRGIADFDTVLRLKNDEARAYFKRGNARARLDDFKGAISDYRKAIQLDPTDADAYFNRGVVMYNLGETSSALEDVIRSGEIYAERGDAAGREKAASALRQILGSVKKQ